MLRPLYAVTVGAILLALAAQFLAGPLAAVFPPERGATGAQALLVVLSISMLFDPIPSVLHGAVPGFLAAVLGWLQCALVIRRILIWIRARALTPPPSVTKTSAVLLVLGMVSWLIGTAVFLSPILLSTLGMKDAVWAAQIGNALLTAALYIPAANIFGVTFFTVELLSLQQQGMLGRRGSAEVNVAPATARRPVTLARRSAIGIAIGGIALISIPPLWSLFPTGMVHQRLCSTRAGEHVVERVRAESYVLVGEGARDDGLHLLRAVEDVVKRRVRFIEVPKIPGSFAQRDSFITLVGAPGPQPDAFRISLGYAGAPRCISAIHRIWGPDLQVPEGECIQVEPIAKPISRYRVEVVDGEQPAWFTPDIRAYGVRVIDADRDVTLGAHLRFERVGLTSLFLVGENDRSCPAKKGFWPVRLHGKVLFGDY